MKRWITLLAVTSCMAAVCALILVQASRKAAAGVSQANALTTTETIDSARSVSLQPLSAAQEASISLSPTEAWLLYSTSAGEAEPEIPSHVAVLEAAMDLPSNNVGPEDEWTWTAQDRPVFAFYTDNVGCLVISPAPDSPSSCREWTFLDAATGAHIETTYEPEAEVAAG